MWADVINTIVGSRFYAMYSSTGAFLEFRCQFPAGRFFVPEIPLPDDATSWRQALESDRIFDMGRGFSWAELCFVPAGRDRRRSSIVGAIGPREPLP